MYLHAETVEDLPLEEASGSKALESPPVKLALEADAKKSKKRKRRGHCSTMVANDCHITKLEKSYTRVMLSLTKPSYLLGLGSNYIRHENRMRLFNLLQKLVRQHNWKEAAGVLGVFLKATRKDKSPILNRFKYTVLLDLLKHIEGDDVSLSAISGIYDTWMTRIGTNLANKRTKDGQMKEDSFVVRLQFILSRVLQGDIEAERHNVKILMEERGYENHPFFNMILGLISSQLWYSSLPEEIQWKDTFKIHSPTCSDQSPTPSQIEMSATRFSHDIGDSAGHNTAFNEESGASFRCDSETSVMKEKEISVEDDGSFNREVLPVKVDKQHKENLQIDFQPRGFYVNSAESDASFDNNGGQMRFVPNLTAFENLGSWLLPLRTGNWDLDRIVHDEEYRNAVKYLQEAIHSTPPVPAALLPLVQLLLIGCKDKEALDEIEKFCAISSGALPKRMKANLLERVDPNNSVILATCYEDTLKSDPKCSHSLARLIRLHQKGDYSPQSLLEMIALHLDAVFVEHDTWREFALCFLKVSRCEEDEMSVCLHGNEGEKRQSYSFCYNGIPKMFTHGKSVGLWRSRCRWWSTRHFSKSILASEIDAGDWQLLTYKAACASHMYGKDFGYVAKAYTCIRKENNRDLSMFLRQHMQNSIGFYSQLQRGNS
ncbi:hypothetical protein SADUNF_Sadunf12G0084000 [Salix dunnii]|uniref:Uncharacterized protein n=1 Tax=Salix dunnii TaxID=1413687 RepID=A0A835JNJ6_9ROSI|nr:hypothetical protein SADUNF_Sadunf12G0084000 [Salix dunnii]